MRNTKLCAFCETSPPLSRTCDFPSINPIISCLQHISSPQVWPLTWCPLRRAHQVRESTKLNPAGDRVQTIFICFHSDNLKRLGRMNRRRRDLSWCDVHWTTWELSIRTQTGSSSAAKSDASRRTVTRRPTASPWTQHVSSSAPPPPSSWPPAPAGSLPRSGLTHWQRGPVKQEHTRYLNQAGPDQKASHIFKGFKTSNSLLHLLQEKKRLLQSTDGTVD